ncbi:hypothetical protein F5X99DRAFT_171856 [Biscogniauxia marginata]|nr:hypothetical protein F5X99DRAFT_171856 [Biscogniauxia marginata]
MDIGRIQSSLASATQETTFALANANFDFSLIRYEAPAEYKELGRALAKKKRFEAEDGPAHTTASRLGSLFHSILPETPNLIRAYGTRASEIATSPIVNPRGTEEHGPFKDYIGVDGTSIWAAATSSPAAIAAHLLACMIACCWKPDEATAIWMEIVSERKRRLEEKANEVGGGIELTEAITYRLSLDKDQLANWDASARAWLMAANDAPVVNSRQKAVRALLNKLNASVSSQQDVYTSVIEAWKLSLDTLEKVICGMSYSVHDGAVVLALMSWHLYPDLVVLGSRTLEISQKDNLVKPGGIITIGLTAPAIGGTSKYTGVHWSLSLGHLRYYGTGQRTSRSLVTLPSGNSRFTYDEFVLVILGALIGNWCQQEKISMESAIDFIKLVVTRFEESLAGAFDSEVTQHALGKSWIYVIRKAIHSCNTKSFDQTALKFLNLGRRHPNFVSKGRFRVNYRLFGLDTLRFVEALKDPNDQDAFLANSFKRLKGRLNSSFKCCILRLSKSTATGGKVLYYSTFSIDDLENHEEGDDVIQKIEPDGGYLINSTPGSIVTHDINANSRMLLWFRPPQPIVKHLHSLVINEESYRDGGQPGFRFGKLAETQQEIIYIARLAETINTGHWDDIPQSYEEIQQCLREKPLDPNRLIRLVNKSSTFRFLQFLAIGADIYSELPGATISPGILGTKGEFRRLCDKLVSLNFYDDPYERNTSILIPRPKITCEDAFRLVAFFETGHDLEKELSAMSSPDWTRVLAISIQDTLYIDSGILGDPTAQIRSRYKLRRVRGNVGRPGLTLIGWLSNLPKMECKGSDLTRWQVVNHNPFDGKLEDYFGSTSLHLRFTGYARELDFGAHNRISNGAIVDATVSAYDTGE